MVYILRDYQQEASDAAVRFFSNKKSKRNGIIILPTGGGKSLLIADIAKRLKGNVIVLQPSKEILEQNYSKYKSYGMDDCSIYSASFNKREILSVTFATIGSVMANLDEFDIFKAVIIDECHYVNAAGGQYKEFIEKVDRKVLGLTATPYRLYASQGIVTPEGVFKPNGSFREEDYFEDDGYHPKFGVSIHNSCILKFLTRTRPRIFHDVIYEVSIQTLLQRGYLAQLKYFDIPAINSKNIKRNSTGRDYDEDSLFEEYRRSGFNQHLVNIVRRLLNPKSGIKRKGILVFTRFLDESWALANEIEGVAVLTGETSKKERETIINEFKAGRIKVLTNVGVLTCLSDDTEILTRNKGWVKKNDVDLNDLIAQYNQDTAEISFANPLRIVQDDNFREDFVELSGRHTNFLVTHNHKILYCKRAEKGLGVLRKCNASEIVNKKVFIPVSGFAAADITNVQQEKRYSDKRFIAANSYNYRKKGMKYADSIKRAKEMLGIRNNRIYKTPDQLTLDECRFIGFWLGDGSKHQHMDMIYTLTQSLGTPKLCEWIENVMVRCGIVFSYCEYKAKEEIINGRICHTSGHRTYTLSKGTGGDKQHVSSNLYALLLYLEKKGTELFWGLNREQYFCLMEGLFKADGYHGNDFEYTGQPIIGQYKELFDLLQAIGVCRGYRVSINVVKKRKFNKHQLYKISLRDKRFHGLTHDTPKLKQNTERQSVWCVTMPQGNIVTRRNGRVTIMGNCGFDYPELDTIVMARPTMSLAQWYQIVGRAIRPFPGKEGWIVDLGENIKRFGKVEDLRFTENKPGEYAINGIVQGQDKQLTNVYF